MTGPYTMINHIVYYWSD